MEIWSEESESPEKEAAPQTPRRHTCKKGLAKISGLIFSAILPLTGILLGLLFIGLMLYTERLMDAGEDRVTKAIG